MHATEDQIIDHVLGDTEAAVSAHVAECAACQQEAEAIGRVLEATEYVPDMPDNLPTLVLERLAPRLERRPQWPRYALAAAAMVAIAVVSAVITARLMRAPAKNPAAVQPQIARTPQPAVTAPLPAPAPPVRHPAARATQQAKAPRRRSVPKEAPPLTVTVTPESVQPPEMPETTASLAEIARTDPSLDGRLDAIRKLGLKGPGEASQYLVDLYRSEPEVKARLAIVEVLLIQNNPSEVEKLAAGEKDRALANTIRAAVREFRARRDGGYLAIDPNPGAPPVDPTTTRPPGGL